MISMGKKQTLFAMAVCVAGVADTATAQTNTITVPAGSDLRVIINKGGRIKKAGQPVEATLVAPLYVGETLAIPVGAQITGHVASVDKSAKGVRVSRLLNGDFTPPRFAEVALDTVVLQDGTRQLLQTRASAGISGVHSVRYLPKDQKPGFRAQLKETLEPLHAPHKLQRLGEAVWNTLPYHPNFIDQGTVFDAMLDQPVTLPAPKESVQEVVQRELLDPTGKLYLRLTSSVTSAMATGGSQITATVTRPYYSSLHHTLLYPTGSQLTGTVTTVKAARWLHRNGDLRFRFETIQIPGQAPQSLDATLDGLEAPNAQALSVDSEGRLRANTSRLEQGIALASVISPSTGLADKSLEKTAFERGGEGQSGFGFIGSGAAQASVNTAIGFGYYGAAKAIYSAFIAKGSDVALRANTPLVLRMDEGPALTATVTVPEKPAALDKNDTVAELK